MCGHDCVLKHPQEMDYQLEAGNTMTFKAHMAQLSGIKVASVYPELTSRNIIVTEWIEVCALSVLCAENWKRVACDWHSP
jgi:predicted unusual protein kinase regulating ubiquinone biosynthesis (AarF/ABC1/UbiB family)